MAKIYLLYGVLHPEDFLHSYGVIHAVKFTEGHRVHKTTIVLKNSIVQIIKYIVMEYTLGSNFLKNMEFFKYHIFEELHRDLFLLLTRRLHKATFFKAYGVLHDNTKNATWSS